MTTAPNQEHNSRKPLRLRAGVIIAVIVAMVRFIPIAAPNTMLFGSSLPILALLGGAIGGLVILAWWLFFSRAPWLERLGAVAVMIVALYATSFVVHPSISNGMMGTMLPIYAIPVLTLSLVVWAVASRRLPAARRRAWMAVTFLIACLPFTLVRTGGITGDGESDLHWRWTATAEERLLAQERDITLAPPPAAPPAEVRSTPAPPAASEKPAALPEKDASPEATAPVRTGSSADPAKKERGSAIASAPAAAAVTRRAQWPGFRGPNRDGIVHGVLIQTDWSNSAPVELWRRPIGPGWSSFAVQGDLIYTQEQRGDDEVVSCYRLATGEPVWRHRDPARFWESNAGAGPRATPTLSNGRVYTMGATGIVNALDATTGARIWTRNAAADTKKQIPDWGLASSPLVIDDVVIVAAAGHLVAYDRTSGAPRWFGPTGGGGYSSPHLVTIDGVPQVVLMRGSRTISVAPATGALLWEHNWEPAVAIVQPGVIENRDILVAFGDPMGGLGARRLSVAHQAGSWKVEDRWTSNNLKPYYNDYVVVDGYAYGFDRSIMACIDLADGSRKWKGGRYGYGQLVLLAEQKVLLVLAEEGDVALVKASPDGFTELARMPALEGKTWNHPVVAGNILLVRNDQEMVAFRLPVAGS
jgi:outer membrane protein assembly factor BamB